MVSVVTSADIIASGAHDLATVIDGQSGVVIHDNGAQGAVKSVSLRGSTSSQVLVLVDGVRLNSSRDGVVDFSMVPLENIDHVEIVRGSASTMYGTGAIGGVINIIRKNPLETRFTADTTFGSSNTPIGSAMGAVRMGKWKLVWTGDAPPRLYDLAADIEEEKDLAAEHPAMVRNMQEAWKAWNKKNILATI